MLQSHQPPKPASAKGMIDVPLLEGLCWLGVYPTYLSQGTQNNTGFVLAFVLFQSIKPHLIVCKGRKERKKNHSLPKPS